MQGLPKDIPKDITNIIHRIVWLSFIKQCAQQYHRLFRTSLYGDYIVCRGNGLILNDRTQTTGDYQFIYNFRKRKKMDVNVLVSNNYKIN